MTLTRSSLLAALLFSSSISPHNFSTTCEKKSFQRTRQSEIEEKIQDEKSKLPIDGVLFFGGLTVFYIGTRNKTQTLTDAQQFTTLVGTILTGVGTLLGVKSLQELFILNKKLKQQTNTSPESETSCNK